MRLKALEFDASGDATGCNCTYRIYDTAKGFNLIVYGIVYGNEQHDRLATNVSEVEAVNIANEHHKEVVMKLFDLEIE